VAQTVSHQLLDSEFLDQKCLAEMALESCVFKRAVFTCSRMENVSNFRTLASCPPLSIGTGLHYWSTVELAICSHAKSISGILGRIL